MNKEIESLLDLAPQQAADLLRWAEEIVRETPEGRLNEPGKLIFSRLADGLRDAAYAYQKAADGDAPDGVPPMAFVCLGMVFDDGDGWDMYQSEVSQ